MPMLPAAPRTRIDSPAANRACASAKWATGGGAPKRDSVNCRQPGRQCSDVGEVRNCAFGVGTADAGERPRALPDPGRVDALADADNSAGDFASRYQSRRKSAVQRATSDDSVHTADTYCLGLNKQLSGPSFVLILMAGRGLSAASIDNRVAAARRFAALAIDGFRAGETARLLASA